LQKGPEQPLPLESTPSCKLISQSNQTASIVLDFGLELHGYVEFFTPQIVGGENHLYPRIRVRLGESVSETMAELGEKKAQNDGSARDQTVALPWLGTLRVGPSGFRFVRVDAAEPNIPVFLSRVRAVLALRDMPYVGSFRCNDEMLNRVWQTGAYTVHLNMQEYLWDGIKRDRMVWVGDMYPEINVINAVFGRIDVVPRSLDFVRDASPLVPARLTLSWATYGSELARHAFPPPNWMNGISAYSLWWILIQEQLWLHYGDRTYLESQKSYLYKLTHRLCLCVGDDGAECLDGMRFVDHPTFQNEQATHEGLQGLLLLSLQSGARLSDALGDGDTADLCLETVKKLRQHIPAQSGRKSAAALTALAGLRNPKEVADRILKKDGPSDLSPFSGYFVLQALGKSGDVETALDYIKAYWGAMLEYGASTFWEDFDLAWTNNAAPIDDIVPAGKADIHGDRCRLQFQESLCHGWSAGPTAWLSEFVLGIKPLEPGFKRVQIAPALGKLKWAEGTYPTPFGPIKVRHERRDDGTIESKLDVPKEIQVERR
jgi:hypothetical protein